MNSDPFDPEVERMMGAWLARRMAAGRTPSVGEQAAHREMLYRRWMYTYSQHLRARELETEMLINDHRRARRGVTAIVVVAGAVTVGILAVLAGVAGAILARFL